MAILPENRGAAQQAPSAILVAHNGALGDFLCCWPGMLAIARHFGGKTNNPPLYFLGREAMYPWALPLGYAACPSSLRAAAENLYVAPELPAALANSKIFWFCLDKPPNFPCLRQEPPPEVIPLPILRPPSPHSGKHNPGAENPHSHVLTTLKGSLELAGLDWPPDWRNTWQSLFGGWQGQHSREIALLPGSGHKHKEWPLRYFMDLADKLARQAWDPVFIVGETEQERGLLPPAGLRWENPSPPLALANRLCKVRAMVSNDAGPAHLAGMHGVPGVVLFGPTPPQTWGVPGMNNLTRHGLCLLEGAALDKEANDKPLRLKFNFNESARYLPRLACSPCTITLRDISCPTPLCMESISLDLVWDILAALLKKAP